MKRNRDTKKIEVDDIIGDLQNLVLSGGKDKGERPVAADECLRSPVMLDPTPAEAAQRKKKRGQTWGPVPATRQSSRIAQDGN